MDYDRSDTSAGTEDDIPPTQPSRASRGGRFSGNGRAISGAYHGQTTTDQHLRKLEQDAYFAVLQAFNKQAGVLTWAKVQLMTTLRKELRISDEQHLSIVQSIESNGRSCPIREQRFQGDDEREGPMYAATPMLDPVPASVTNAAQKRQKTTRVSQAALPTPAMKPAALPSPPSAPTFFPGKRAPPVGSKSNKKSKGRARQQPNTSSLNTKPVLSAALGSAPTINPWIGRRVQTRWPADNAFYEAVITDYNPENGLHALVYEINAENETWEWVNLKELSSDELKLVDGPPVFVTRKGPSASALGGQGTAGRGSKKSGGRSGLISSGGRARSAIKGPTSSFEKSAPSGVLGRNWKGSTAENGVDVKQVQLPSLDALVKQVDKIAQEDDLAKIETVKRAAKEHEEMLRKALAEVGEFSEEGETVEEEHPPFSHTHSLNLQREPRSKHGSRDRHGSDDEGDTAGDREGSDGEPLMGDGGVASDAEDDHQDDDDDG